MTDRLSAALLLFALGFPVSARLLAQTRPPASPPLPVEVVPAQNTPVEPPSPSATAEELEQKADLLRAEKRLLDAIDYYTASLKKKPDHPDAIYNKMGVAQLQLGKMKDAERSFDHAIHANRKFPEAYNNLGVVYQFQKKFGKAEKQYKRALELREDSASFHSNLGTAYFGHKKFEQAMEEYQRALQLDPLVFERRSQAGIAAQMSSPEDRAHYSYVLARMYAKTGDFDRSLTYLRKAMEDGYKQIDDVYKEPEFASLRKDPRFAELMASRPVAIPQ